MVKGITAVALMVILASVETSFCTSELCEIETFYYQMWRIPFSSEHNWHISLSKSNFRSGSAYVRAYASSDPWIPVEQFMPYVKLKWTSTELIVQDSYHLLREYEIMITIVY